MSIVLCLLVQFSFKSAAECKGQVANSQWQRVPDRRAGRGGETKIIFALLAALFRTPNLKTVAQLFQPRRDVEIVVELERCIYSSLPGTLIIVCIINDKFPFRRPSRDSTSAHNSREIQTHSDRSSSCCRGLCPARRSAVECSINDESTSDRTISCSSLAPACTATAVWRQPASVTTTISSSSSSSGQSIHCHRSVLPLPVRRCQPGVRVRS